MLAASPPSPESYSEKNNIVLNYTSLWQVQHKYYLLKLIKNLYSYIQSCLLPQASTLSPNLRSGMHVQIDTESTHQFESVVFYTYCPGTLTPTHIKNKGTISLFILCQNDLLFHLLCQVLYSITVLEDLLIV